MTRTAPAYRWAAAVLALLVWPAAGAPSCLDGLVVETVAPGFAAHVAGLVPGDVLCAWERAVSLPANAVAAGGRFTSAFDILVLEQEEAPRGDFRLTVAREAATVRLTVPPGLWRVGVRPPLAEAELGRHEQARARLATPEYEHAFALWKEMARSGSDAGEHAKAAWLYYTLARAAVEKRSWDAADEAFKQAVSASEAARDPAAAGFVRTFHGRSMETRGRLEEAAAIHGRALDDYRALGAPSLLEAWGLAQAGRVAIDRGELDAAEEIHRTALSIRRRLAPESMEVAGSLLSLGMVAGDRGDLGTTEQQYRRALAIGERLAPEGIDFATMLGNMGSVLFKRGDVAAAEEHFRRALVLRERLTPDTVAVATHLHNLGAVAAAREDLAAAERYQRRAFEIYQRRTPNSLVGTIALRSLARIALRRGDLASAEDSFRRAVELAERAAPQSLDVASGLMGLGLVAKARKDWETAHGYADRARKLLEGNGIEGLTLADTLQALGEIARARGDLDGADHHLRRALAIRSDRAPGNVAEAETCHELALLERSRGRTEPALELHGRALAALEHQWRRLGGTDEARSGFAARFAGYYRDTVDLLLEAQRPAEAFHVVERYRARGLLALLAERDLVYSADVPPELDRERRITDSEYDRALADLRREKGNAREGRERLVGLRLRQAEIRDKIRAASPRLADLQSPRPLELEGVRAVLDPGTVLLSYLVGPEKSYLFVVGPGPDELKTVRLDVDVAALRADVGRFREMLAQSSGLSRRQLQRLAQDLSARLLAPAKDAVRRAERVLVVPDGPLHLVPFAALADPGRADRFFVEARPVHVAASATVFAEIKKARRPTAAVRVVAFGDPDYSSAASPARGPRSSDLRSAQERGLDLRPLPASRREVEDLRRLYPHASRIHVGREATEERAKTDGREASVIHLACHGLADENAPLDSSLALSMPANWKPGEANGLLQAWEIFEQVRIDADLVTLSACGTALGKEMSGEGILGLTRAFQYAGARSVLASLWAVRDDSTADLMRRFYRHLQAGKTKDAALRAAQMEMIGSGRSHPGRWAAFQLVGDWR